MTTPLPEKIHLNGRYPDDLSAGDRTKYAAYYAEKARRKDPTQPGVAQEAIDCVEELLAAGRSPSEAWTTYGYSLQHALKPAKAEEKRIVAELLVKPSKDVTSSILDVAAVKVAKEIPEYVKPVVKDPKVIEPIVEP